MKYTKDNPAVMSHPSVRSVGRFTYEGSLEILTWGEGAELDIGSFCSIGSQVTIFLGGNHPLDRASTWPFHVLTGESAKGFNYTNGDVVIGNDVWIGNRATIMSGTRIDDGAVIGANAVVSGHVWPYEVWAGNPAERIRYRLPMESINAMLEVKWWDFPEHILKDLVPIMGDITAFLDACRLYRKIG